MATAYPLPERHCLAHRAWFPPIPQTPGEPIRLRDTKQPPLEPLQRDELVRRVFALEEEIKRIRMMGIGFIKVNLLPTKTLKVPIDAIVEPDDDGFIARTTDIPLYGYGDDPIEAVEALESEIESLYDDLTVDDEFTDEWLKIKEFLQQRIVAPD